MVLYILKRLLIFIPTLIIISLAAFIISINAPGDPVERLMRAADSEGGTSEQSVASKQARQQLREDLGLDRPVFYVGISTMAHPDTLYRVADRDHKKMLGKLAVKNGNWGRVSDYYHALVNYEAQHKLIVIDSILKQVGKDSLVIKVDSISGALDSQMVFKPQYSRNEITDVRNLSNVEVASILQTADMDVVSAKFDSLAKLYSEYEFMSPLVPELEGAKQAFNDMNDNAQKWKAYIPSLKFNSFNNQYHNWAKNIILYGDFGKSYMTGQPIKDKIWDAFKYSFWLSIAGIILGYIISLPIGIWSAYKKDGMFDRLSSLVLFVLYSMPVFFVGTWLLYTFANPDNFVWVPESGVENPASFDKDWSWWQKAQHRLPFFILPVLTSVYGSFAFLSRIMRVSIIEVFGQDYIRTARAKGLREHTVVMKHALRNSLLPLITMFANIFPVAVGGSIIIEKIFSIPGMGTVVLDAVLNQDYPVIVTVFTLLGFVTMIGYLVSDILYAVADPRISYSKK